MPLDTFMLFVTNLGSPQSIFVLCLTLVFFLAVHKKPHHLLQFVIFMSLGALSVWLLKHTFEIPRPTGGIIFEYGYGFPSGHATMATLFLLLLVYSYLSHLKNRLEKTLFILGGIVIAGLISYSRIYLGVHSWTDVVGGISLGLLWFVLSVIFYTHIEKKHF